MEFYNLSELKKNPVNDEIRRISGAGKEEMEKDMLLGQISTFLIELPGKIILGGNHHYDEYIAQGIDKVKCITVEFKQEPEGFMAIVDGEPQRSRFFKTIEEARFIYARAHNGMYAVDNPEGLVQYAKTINVKAEEIRLNIQEPMTIAKMNEMAKAKEDLKKYFIRIKCSNESEQKEIAEKLTGMNLDYKLINK